MLVCFTVCVFFAFFWGGGLKMIGWMNYCTNWNPAEYFSLTMMMVKCQTVRIICGALASTASSTRRNTWPAIEKFCSPSWIRLLHLRCNWTMSETPSWNSYIAVIETKRCRLTMWTEHVHAGSDTYHLCISNLDDWHFFKFSLLFKQS